MTWTRRQLLQAGGATAGLALSGLAAVPSKGSAAGVPAPVAKRLSLVNLHTTERLDLTYCRGTDYVPGALSAISVLLRDARSDQRHAIDPTLMDTLYDVARQLEVDAVFQVISGYRSPSSNEVLRERNAGVARHSLHLEGRAIDVRLAGVGSAVLAACAREMNRGGVGYYRKSDFVHLDTGAYRTWNG